MDTTTIDDPRTPTALCPFCHEEQEDGELHEECSLFANEPPYSNFELEQLFKEARGMNIIEVIATRRTNDWMAWTKGDKGHWEAGATEAEAVGKLIMRLRVHAEFDDCAFRYVALPIREGEV